MKALRFLIPLVVFGVLALATTGVAFAREMIETQAFEGHSVEIEFTGPVESISAFAWTVSGRQMAVTPETEIEAALAVGDTVKVHAIQGEDGSLTAREIEAAVDQIGNDNDSGNDNGNDNDSGNDNGNDNDSGNDNDNGNDNDSGNDNGNDNDSGNDNGNDNDSGNDNGNDNDNDNDSGNDDDHSNDD